MTTATPERTAPRIGQIIPVEVRDVDPNEPIFDGIDTTSGPRFSTAEVAKFFFGKSSHWMRWRERSGQFSFDGEFVSPERSSNIRSYTLGDIENLAKALAEHEAINPQQLIYALRLLSVQGKINRLIA